MKLDSITEQAVELLRNVGLFIQQEAARFDHRVVEEKGLNDLVSYVDKEAEKLLVAGLSELLPGCGFIAEEGTAKNQDERYLWIVDPLDGTTNFTHGLPVYSISVALLQDKELVAGIVYELNHDEMFVACKHGGAFCNGKPISVSDRPVLAQSLLATGFPYYNFAGMNNYLDILRDFMQATHGLRRLGSAAVDLAYVACGRFEGFFEYNLNSWDVAAGALIVQEAGGKVSDFSGGDKFLFGREIIAAGPVHGEMQQTIARHWF
jgi:myo-inositol-1(or 4)-monophosphatase